MAKCALSQSRTFTLLIRSVLPAQSLQGGGVSAKEATAAVCSELLGARSDGQVVVGIDSPPAIAMEFIKEKQWSTWAQRFSTIYKTPEDFREATSLATQSGARREPKRRTDVEHKTPLPPQNLRMFKQTWWAIRGIFAPLPLVAMCFQPDQSSRDQILERPIRNYIAYCNDLVWHFETVCPHPKGPEG